MPESEAHRDLEKWRREVDLKLALVSRIKTDLYNGDDDPKAGLVAEIRAYMVEERAERKKRWTRSQLLAAGSILVLLAAAPSAKIYSFISDVDSIVQEWHEVHKTQLEKKSFFDYKAPALTSNQSTDAGAESTGRTQ